MKKANNIVKRITGIAAAAVIAASTMTAAAVSASASGPDNNRPLVYFEPCGDWGECGAQMKAYFFNKKDNNFRETWKDMQFSNGKLYTTAPADYDTVVFTRHNPSNLNEIWNQTYDLTVQAGMTFKATAFEGKYYTGSWVGNQTKADEPQTEAAKNTEITFVPSNEWTSDGARFMVYAYNANNGKSEWVTPGKRSAEALTYTANVPSIFTHVVIVRLPGNAGNSFDEAWNKTPNINISKLQGAYHVNGWELDKYQEGKCTDLF